MGRGGCGRERKRGGDGGVEGKIGVDIPERERMSFVRHVIARHVWHSLYKTPQKVFVERERERETERER